MRKRKNIFIYILIAIIAILLLSCKSRKTITKEHKDLHAEQTDSSHSSISKRDSFILDRIESTLIGIEIEITKYTIPDSLGRQYITEITNVKVDSKKDVNENLSGGSDEKEIKDEKLSTVVDNKGIVEVKELAKYSFTQILGWCIIALAVIVGIVYVIKKNIFKIL